MPSGYLADLQKRCNTMRNPREDVALVALVLLRWWSLWLFFSVVFSLPAQGPVSSIPTSIEVDKTSKTQRCPFKLKEVESE